MGDYYTVLAPSDGEVNSPEQIAEKGLDWLFKKQIFEPTKTDCVLGDNGGYSPTRNIKDIFKTEVLEGELELYLTSVVKGLEVITERTIFYIDEGSLDKVICTNCKSNIIEGEWFDFLENWYKGYSDGVICDNCGKAQNIHSYKFLSGSKSWLFSNFGFKFWNLPSKLVKDTLVSSLESLLKCKLSIITGKL